MTQYFSALLIVTSNGEQKQTTIYKSSLMQMCLFFKALLKIADSLLFYLYLQGVKREAFECLFSNVQQNLFTKQTCLVQCIHIEHCGEGDISEYFEE